ncbi:MAG: hypothetical protein K9K64_03715 [Desulfohalobiaceae bacterium]|nr:hypothetical protein [Desulfohalobiaceae bacterium]
MKHYLFDKNFTFDNFYYNTKNAFPVISAREIVDNPKAAGNPFIISGGTGSGKSHLLRAVANQYLERQQDNVLLLGTAELERIFRKQRKDQENFTNKIKSFAVVMLDDFQLITEYPGLRSELALCFKQLRLAGTQIVLACTGKIIDLDLPTEMKSRLLEGALVELKNPDLDVRLTFLQRQFEKNHLELPENDLFEIATTCTDFKKICGIFYSLLFNQEFAGQEKDLHRVVTSKIREMNQGPDIRSIIQTVSRYFELSPHDLISGRREKSVSQSRQMAMTLCRDLLGLTYAQIGSEFGGRNHSSVLYSIKKIRKLQVENQDLNHLFNVLKKNCL